MVATAASAEGETGFALLVQQLETGAGLLSFASLLLLCLRSAYKVGFSFNSLVRVMVYLDCLAFVFFYTSRAIGATTSAACTSVAMFFFADYIWALKDGMRVAYLVYCGLTSQCQRMPRTVIASGVMAVVLSMALAGLSYQLSGSDGCQRNVSPFEPLIVLYLYFMVTELFAGILVVTKRAADLPDRETELDPEKQQQNGRKPQSSASQLCRPVPFHKVSFLLALFLQFWAALQTIIERVVGSTGPSLVTVILGIGQFVLVISTIPSNKVNDNSSSTSPSTDTNSSRNGLKTVDGSGSSNTIGIGGSNVGSSSPNVSSISSPISRGSNSQVSSGITSKNSSNGANYSRMDNRKGGHHSSKKSNYSNSNGGYSNASRSIAGHSSRSNGSSSHSTRSGSGNSSGSSLRSGNSSGRTANPAGRKCSCKRPANSQNEVRVNPRFVSLMQRPPTICLPSEDDDTKPPWFSTINVYPVHLDCPTCLNGESGEDLKR